MEKRIERVSGGLQCDNTECDWKDDSIKVEEYEKHLNAACPKCGENILTEEDYINVLKFNSIIDFVNSRTDKQIREIENHPDFKEVDLGIGDFKEGEEVLVHFNLHKGIAIESIEKVKK